MPSAITATKVKLRVTLKRLFEVAKELVASERKMQAAQTASALEVHQHRIAEEEGLHPRVLLEVNVAGEGSKIGFEPETLRPQFEKINSLGRITVEGLMTIPPLAEEAQAARKYFVGLHELRDRLEQEFQIKLPQLSMGMSHDFLVAIEEGATLVRVGTAIFGSRTPMRLRANQSIDD